MTTWDLLVNALRGVGTSDDTETGWTFGPDHLLDTQQLTYLYQGSGIAQRACALPGEALAAAGLELEPAALERVEERHKLTSTLGAALTWARLYGGGGVVIEVVGDTDWSLPWCPRPGQRVRLHAVSGLVLEPAIDTRARGWCEEPDLPACWGPLARADRPRHWRLQPTYWRPGIVGLVHWTRILPLYGVRMPPGSAFLSALPQTWEAVSALQPARRALIGYHALQGDLRRLGGVLGIWGAEMPGLEELTFQQTQDNAESLVDAAVARWTRNKVMVGPAGAKLTAQSLSLSGVAELTAWVRADLCAALGLSEQRLFGMAPSGLNTDGESWKTAEKTQLLSVFEASGWRDACWQALTGLAIVAGCEAPVSVELGEIYESEETERQERADEREAERLTIDLVKAGLLSTSEGRTRLGIEEQADASTLTDNLLIALDATELQPWLDAGLAARPDLTGQEGGPPNRWPHVTLAHLRDVPLPRAQAIARDVAAQMAKQPAVAATPAGWGILGGAAVEMLQAADLAPLWLGAMAALAPSERAAQFNPWAPHVTLGWLPDPAKGIGDTPALSGPFTPRIVVVKWGPHVLARIPLAQASDTP